MMNQKHKMQVSAFARIALAFYLTFLALPTATTLAEQASIDLSGEWGIRLDPTDTGIAEGWHSLEFKNVIQLPASLQEAGYGDDPAMDSPWTGAIKNNEWNKPQYSPYKTADNFKIPFWLQPDKIYMGAAWYQREVEIPQAWQGKHIELQLERAHWQTIVWVDGHKLSTQDSLATPHHHDLSSALTPGKHTISIQVDNRMIVDVGHNAHSVTDHTQSNWNGLTGELKLVARSPVWIENVQVYPNAKQRKATVKVDLGNQTGAAGSGLLSWQVSNNTATELSGNQTVSWNQDGGTAELLIDMGTDALLWDEFNPNLYQLEIKLESGDRKEVTFGLRDLKAEGTRFTINERPVFLRGTLECAVFPLTGYPATDVESWRRIIRISKEHGLNHIRFHSWCPPKAAFIAADEEGFYLQAEASAWTKIGTGAPVDAWLYKEAQSMVDAYGNHPSFVMMAYGNEPTGPGRGGVFLKPWVKHWKEVDPRRMHTGAAGWPRVEGNDFHNVANPRLHMWGARLKSRLNAKAPDTRFDFSGFINANPVPVVAHESGEWTVYPNFDEIEKYTGVLKAKNYEVFRDLLADHHMADLADDFLMASGRLQVICYKQEVEAALRTPGFAGFQLLSLTDFPGQGTAPVGILDAFWDSKPYIDVEEWSQFCNVTVPLARMPKRTWTTAESFSAALEVSHFGSEPLKPSKAAWQILSAEGHVVAQGATNARDIPLDNAIKMGNVNVQLSELPAPAEYTLKVALEGADARNEWKFWVYPETVATSADDVVIVHSVADASAALKDGGKVLLLANKLVKNDIQIGFSSNFWNIAWTNNQAPHTMGILCNPKHPVFSEFPTSYHSDWQWWDLIHDSHAMILEDLPPKFRPLVHSIDNWFDARRLGMLVEAEVDGGKLMISSLNLDGDLEKRPAARQMMASIINYMASPNFVPEESLSVEQFSKILNK
ncbi:glycoside hydrolase family 2 TIM barrel-domain containing protein [Coraliomargarita algicola]|uniref:Glycoside hydrolase family 2 TIM barrel-domain containing protein n=1 Tax=Coraliomargarita algicola TaxID=3092156 RepID=A0ABZ0RGS8_9BACT|nr:sugar-binding domain-containing protein [Coraliomargarita sp. J2-16]WPJ95384.1 glycoside hydrolase family 2 TIM barrel-domain containing protein [Coraliomargarita sp. J2-16]